MPAIPISPDTKLRRKPNLAAVDMDGETVMMDSDSGHYFALKGIGGFLWEQMKTEVTAAELVARVTRAFAAEDSEDIAQDVLEFLSQLTTNGLVQPVGGP